MFLFWRSKNDPETSGRKALLAYLTNLEKRGLIQWTPRIPDISEIFSAGSIAGTSSAGQCTLNIILTFSREYVFLNSRFMRLSVSLDGNGILELDQQTAPKHWCYETHPHITYLMERAKEAIKKAEGLESRCKSIAKNKKAEQSSREILRHLSLQP